MLQERKYVSQSTTSSVSSEMSVSSEAHMRRKVELVEDYFEDAKKMVQRALKSDEKGERMAALEIYNKALTTLKSGLKLIKTTQMTNSSLIDLMQKMDKLKSQVKTRMTVLLSEEEHSKSHHTTTTTTTRSVGNSSIGVGLVTEGTGGGRRSVAAEADVLFTATTGIKIFRISSAGIVSKCTTADSISVFKYKNKIPGQPPGFLQCGDFIYPLVPGKSPILRTSKRAYVFPDITSDNIDDSVGLMMDRLSRSDLEELNHVLSSMGHMKESAEELSSTNSNRNEVPTTDESNDDKPTWGSTISERLDAGVHWISGVITQGTDKGEDLLNKGGNVARNNIVPRDEPVNVPVPVERGVHYARKATGVVVGVSDFLMISLAKGTVMVGKKVGNVIAESDMAKETEINPHAKEAWKVTKSTVKGAGHVFGDLEKGARAMIRTAGKETSKIADHKYGNEVGKVTDDSLVTAGHAVDLASTYWNWKTWGISFISKVGKVIASESDQEVTATTATTTNTSNTVYKPPPSSTITTSTVIQSSPRNRDTHKQPTTTTTTATNRVTKKEKEVLYA